MEEMSVFIVNLGKYIEGESAGAWFNLPVDFENVKEKIGLDATHEEYAIHDYNLPFEINEYMPIAEINRMAELYLELQKSSVGKVVKDILEYGWFCDMEELAEHVDDIVCYPEYSSMEELAYYLIDECGRLGELSDEVRMYIDYEAFARDEAINEPYLVTNHGVFYYKS